MYCRPKKEVFDGKYVILEKLNSEKHLDDLFENSNLNDDQHSIFTYLPYGPFKTKDDLKVWLLSQEKITDRVIYSVYSKRIGKFVGMSSIINIDEKVGRAEIGSIWYGKLAQRTEINTEATYLLLQYLLGELHYRRIEWKCDNDNSASRKAAERFGFEYEGLFRKHMLVKNKNRDTAWFSIIDDEWDEKKKHFENTLIKPYQPGI